MRVLPVCPDHRSHCPAPRLARRAAAWYARRTQVFERAMATGAPTCSSTRPVRLTLRATTRCPPDGARKDEHTMSFQDKTLTCRDCGQEFTFTAGEQEFYQQRG